ncbi:MAG: hypothetical protein JRJ87_18050 [Deltaproteobacteria bacterium]|nr:hypothetical protein [Deltaproteobacteria bacterium]
MPKNKSISLRMCICWPATILAAAFTLCCCSSGGPATCDTDRDCNPGFTCLNGICKDMSGEPDPGGDDGGSGSDPGGDPGADPGSDAGSDPGSDPGGDSGQPWLITPGLSVGPLYVSATRSNFHSLSELEGLLGEAGTVVGETNYTLSYLNNTLWLSGIDSNAEPNQVFDGEDHIISIAALDGLNARTSEGLGPGSTLAEVRAVGKYQNPNRSAVYPPYGEYPGGKMDFYFGLGLFIGYDVNDQAAFLTVTKPYAQPPDGTIDPANATLTFPGRTIQCGDGYQTGSTQDVHWTVMGEPDWVYDFETEIQTEYGPMNVTFYVDSYRILGMEFIGGDNEMDPLLYIRLRNEPKM